MKRGVVKYVIIMVSILLMTRCREEDNFPETYIKIDFDTSLLGYYSGVEIYESFGLGGLSKDTSDITLHVYLNSRDDSVVFQGVSVSNYYDVKKMHKSLDAYYADNYYSDHGNGYSVNSTIFRNDSLLIHEGSSYNHTGSFLWLNLKRNR